MSRSDFGAWQPITTAPRDGREHSWSYAPRNKGRRSRCRQMGTPAAFERRLLDSSGFGCGVQFVYTDSELVFWMPLPTNFPTRALRFWTQTCLSLHM